MKAYAVTQGGKLRYAATQSSAKETKYALNETAGLPRTAYSGDAAQIEEVEIPTQKDSLLAFLNEIVKKLDPFPSSENSQ